mmetsp:Transcript_10734/g.25606  ORF Transcript_10734/g.25606 Transcript_10734/m.25606 type:complete len:205 (-) Transcript_10734:847-1461(-)
MPWLSVATMVGGWSSGVHASAPMPRREAFSLEAWSARAVRWRAGHLLPPPGSATARHPCELAAPHNPWAWWPWSWTPPSSASRLLNSRPRLRMRSMAMRRRIRWLRMRRSLMRLSLHRCPRELGSSCLLGPSSTPAGAPWRWQRILAGMACPGIGCRTRWRTSRCCRARGAGEGTWPSRPRRICRALTAPRCCTCPWTPPGLPL